MSRVLARVLVCCRDDRAVGDCRCVEAVCVGSGDLERMLSVCYNARRHLQWLAWAATRFERQKSRKGPRRPRCQAARVLHVMIAGVAAAGVSLFN